MSSEVNISRLRKLAEPFISDGLMPFRYDRGLDELLLANGDTVCDIFDSEDAAFIALACNYAVPLCDRVRELETLIIQHCREPTIATLDALKKAVAKVEGNQ